MAHRHFVPAAGHDWLLPLYDPLQRWLGVGAIHDALIESAALAPGARVLDVGCGTGNLVVRLARAHPDAVVSALDPDPKALERARSKASRERVDVAFQQGYAEELPYPDGAFDCVLSSFMFHHLGPETQAAMLRDVHRVLAPAGGAFHLLDFATSGEPGRLARLLHAKQHLGQRPEGLAALLREAGFEAVAEIERRRTLFGGICHLRGSLVADPVGDRAASRAG
jgi:SAM-dependent methyltransferase